MRLIAMEHTFTEAIPDELAEGRLYISIRYRTASHLCACGCGSKVVTPIKPAKWELIYDGDTVSLWPSIGSWQRPCRSHYIIRRGRVIWSRDWTDEEIGRGRRRDHEALERYYLHRRIDAEDRDDAEPTTTSDTLR